MAQNPNTQKTVADRLEELRDIRRGRVAAGTGTVAAMGGQVKLQYVTNHGEMKRGRVDKIEQERTELAVKLLEDAREAAIILHKNRIRAMQEYKLGDGKTVVKGWNIVKTAGPGSPMEVDEHKPLAPGEMDAPETDWKKLSPQTQQRILIRLQSKNLPPPDSPEHRAQIARAQTNALKMETIYAPGAHGKSDPDAEVAALRKRPGHSSRAPENSPVVPTKMVLGEDGRLYKIMVNTPLRAPEVVTDPHTGKRSRILPEPKMTDRHLLRAPKHPGPEQRGWVERRMKGRHWDFGRNHTSDGSRVHYEHDKTTDSPRQIIYEVTDPAEVVRSVGYNTDDETTQDSWRDTLAKFVDLKIGDIDPTTTVYDGEIVGDVSGGSTNLGAASLSGETWDIDPVPDHDLPSGVRSLPPAPDYSGPQPPPPIALGPGPTPPHP
jgi:hypothetical protein